MTRKARHTGSLVTIATLLFWAIWGLSPVAAQSSSPDPTGEEAAPINSMCPVTTDEEIDERFTAMYQGQLIGLCCKKCRRKFEEDPEAYIANLPQLQTAAFTDPEPDHGEDNHADAAPTEPAHEEGAHEHPSDDAGNAAGEAAEHDHAVDHDDDARPRIFTWLGKFHPPATDIPIGMLIGAALAEGLFILSRREMYRSAAAFCVLIAAAGAVPAVTLGWLNAGLALTDDDWVQTTHRWLGTSTGLLTLVTLGLLIASSGGAKRGAVLRYRVALFAAAGLVGVTGFFGGALVYGINHYAW